MRTINVLLVGFGLWQFALTMQAQTIVGIETESYFYADGEMKKSPGQFENTYYLDGNKITRTRVYDRIKKDVIPDDTVYVVQEQLSSHPATLPKPRKTAPNASTRMFPPVIRAVGQPGTDAIEILVIGEDFIQSCKSTSAYFVISRFQRVK